MSFDTPMDTLAALIAARNAHDYEAAFACYAPEATIVVQPGQAGQGAATIHAFIEASSALAITFTNHQVFEAGDIALHTSEYRLDLGERGIVPGRTADVLRRALDGGWRIVIDNAWAG